MHGFLALVGDRNWHATIEQAVPGGIAQAVKDAATFFETEVPSPGVDLRAAAGGGDHLPRAVGPGSNSSPLFVEGRQLLHAWFPACQDAAIVGATHLLRWRHRGR